MLHEVSSVYNTIILVHADHNDDLPGPGKQVHSLPHGFFFFFFFFNALHISAYILISTYACMHACISLLYVFYIYTYRHVSYI